MGIAGVRIGIVEADRVTVAAANTELLAEMERECSRLRKKFTVESLAEASAVVAVRAMFRRWGMDPSKYRPSSEALLRRVVQGKGLYNIANVVDVSNLGSLETGWPYGVYDRAAISGEVRLRLGATGERYEGIGKRVWQLGGRPVLADAHGPFGSPISDSTRTQVRGGVREVFTVIYAPESATDDEVNEALETQARRLEIYAGAPAVRMSLARPIP